MANAGSFIGLDKYFAWSADHVNLSFKYTKKSPKKSVLAVIGDDGNSVAYIDIDADFKNKVIVYDINVGGSSKDSATFPLNSTSQWEVLAWIRQVSHRITVETVQFS